MIAITKPGPHLRYPFNSVKDLKTKAQAYAELYGAAPVITLHGAWRDWGDNTLILFGMAASQPVTAFGRVWLRAEAEGHKRRLIPVKEDGRCEFSLHLLPPVRLTDVTAQDDAKPAPDARWNKLRDDVLSGKQPWDMVDFTKRLGLKPRWAWSDFGPADYDRVLLAIQEGLR